MPNLPLELWHTIFEACLTEPAPFWNISAVSRRTRLIITIRRVCRGWAAVVDSRASYFRECFWNISLLEDVDSTEARNALDALERWFLKADHLILVLQLSASTAKGVHHRLVSLLSHFCRKVVKIHLYCPSPSSGGFTLVVVVFFFWRVLMPRLKRAFLPCLRDAGFC